jgi:hypothetical protein
MARRVIRKLDVAGRTSFDEQLWPVSALLVVLCALSAGVIIGTSQFTHELAWSNGWVRLATLVASAGLLMGLAWWFRGQVGRRFQFGAAVSLLLHALIAILLHWQHLTSVHEIHLAARQDEPSVLVRFEYQVRAPDEQVPREAHERPVDTPTPQDRPVERSRTTDVEPTLQQPQPQPLPETPRSVEPTRVAMKHNEFAAPKRAEAESRLSRSKADVPSQPSEQISAPEQRATSDPNTAPLQSQATAVARREAASATQPTSPQTVGTIEVAPESAQPTRRVAEDASRSAPSGQATPSRAVAQASATPAAAIESPSIAAAATAQPAPAIEAAAAAVARSDVAPPTRQATTEPNTAASPSVASAAAPARREQPESAMALPAAAQPSVRPSRSLASAAASSPATVSAPAVAAATPRTAEQPATLQPPAVTSIDRTASGTIGIGQAPNFDQALPAPASNRSIASAAAQRAASTIDIGPAPAASNPTPLGRSQAQAAVESATALAQDAAPAVYRSGPVPTELEASSAAAISRQSSAAPQAPIAADAGNLFADTGRPSVVSAAGQSRSDGGGQPTIADAANPGQPQRTTASGEAATAVARDSAAQVAAPDAGNAPAPAAPQVAAADNTRDEPPVASVGPISADTAGAATPTQDAVSTASGARASTQTGVPTVTTTANGAPTRTGTSAFSAADDVQLPSTAPTANAGEVATLDARVPALARTAIAATAIERGGPPADAASGVLTDVRPLAARADADATDGGGPDISRQAPLARVITNATTAGDGQAIDVPELASNAQTAETQAAGDAQPGPATGPNAVERRSSGGVPVQIASVAGPGGLAAEPSPVVGSRKLSAQRESDLIHDTDTRFLGREIAGAIPQPSFIRDAAKAFERRGRDNGTGQGQQGAKTEETIERGLDFLARAQQQDGSWSFQRFPGATADDAGSIHSDTAATGLALMAFLGGGYDHFEDKHRDTVRRGLYFLVQRQKETGDLYHAQDAESHNSAWLYSHAIATIAMCEALGMTGDADLQAPAQRAIDFIQSAQDKRFGGWRYRPGEGSDTSVAGWQLMALKSGELAGLGVKPETYQAVRQWLDRAQVPDDGSRYLYNPIQPNTQYLTDQRRPTMTSVGLLMRLYLGWDRTRDELKRGAEQILEYPAMYGTASNPMRDTYYWYYATQVMFHMGGSYWERWRGKLHPLLIESQIKQGPLAGSWHPNGNIPDRWGPHGGRIYVTTMDLLSLEVYYRHLPIYEATAK